MFHIEDVLQLKDTEDVRLIVRRHPITLVPGLLMALLLIVVPFFLLFPLFSWGILGIALFVATVAGGIILAIRSFILWDADVLLITTLRLLDVDQKGVFSRFVTEIPLTSVQDASWRRHGILETVFKIGTLSIQTAGSAAAMTVTRVGHPELIHELINDLRHATTPKRLDLSPEFRERLRRLSKRLESLSPEALDRVEQLVQAEDKEQAVAGFLEADGTQPS